MTEEIIKEDTANNIDLSAEIAEADEVENQVYEVGFHIVPLVRASADGREEDKVAAEVDSIKSIIEKNGGVLITDEFPKLINLAYTMVKDIDGKRMKFDTAYFGWLKFEMKTDSITAVKGWMDNNKNVLRFLIIKTVKESTLAPKTIIFGKDDSLRKAGSKSAFKKKDNTEKKKIFVSEEELDKTIEELITE